MIKKVIASLIIIISLFSIIYYFYPTQPLTVNQILDADDFYSKSVQPIFTAKCVACHSCFNSPCQLNLSSFEGLDRGANQTDIYDFAKLESRPPTRLYIDAHNFQQWKDLGFYKVDTEDEDGNSILKYMISGLPGIESGLQNTYDSETSRVCLTSLKDDERNKYLKQNPAGRMPLGLPKLSDEELRTILKWVDDSTKPDALDVKEAKVLNTKEFVKSISEWETLLNLSDVKSQISSRYIYEHLFLAHIYFESQPNVFFRLVRSKSKSKNIEELPTVYPFDKPRDKFYYRLRPVLNALTHKDHIPYQFSEEKLKNIKKDFYDSKWSTENLKMPAYGSAGSNPFETFKDIPIKARYKFLLEEAGYHIMTFMKGPVCRGPTAVNVINDHFWVMFIDPDKDAMVNSQDLELKIASHSEFPALTKDDILPSVDFRKRFWESVGFKFQHLEKKNDSFDFDHIWNGDSTNTNSLLTIYRHFDSAHVVRGLRGQTPKTVWVIDYQVLESIYYNLTAGYNVFGPLVHQINTRLFMEMSRLASEDMFLNFMPSKQRKVLRASWNKPVPENKESLTKSVVDLFIGDVSDKLKFDYPYFGSELNTKINFNPESNKNLDLKTEFFKGLLKDKFSLEQINSNLDYFKDETNLRQSKSSSKALKMISELSASQIQHLPDTIFLKLTETDQAYTLVNNKEHFNVSMMFLEDDLRNPTDDTLDVIHGIGGSYANLFIVLDEKKLSLMADELSRIKSASDSWEVIKKYGVSRNDPKFWEHHNWFSRQSFESLTNESGLLDLNRYLNL